MSVHIPITTHPPVSRIDFVTWIIDTHGPVESENDDGLRMMGDPYRYIMVEIGAGAYHDRIWYTTSHNPFTLYEHHANQEYAEDWLVEAVYDVQYAEQLHFRQETVYEGRTDTGFRYLRKTESAKE